MIPETFIESVQDIGLGPGIIKINLATLSTTEKDKDGNPKLDVNHRLLMTPYGFLNLLRTMEDAAKGLAEAGILETTEGSEEVAEEAAADNQSPNFK